MWAFGSESGIRTAREAGLKSRTWMTSAAKTIQLARSRTTRSPPRLAPRSQARSTPTRVRTPRITSARRYQGAGIRAELLVERLELGHACDLTSERAHDLRRDLRRAAR